MYSFRPPPKRTPLGRQPDTGLARDEATGGSRSVINRQLGPQQKTRHVPSGTRDESKSRPGFIQSPFTTPRTCGRRGRRPIVAQLASLDRTGSRCRTKRDMLSTNGHKSCPATHAKRL
ncbi:unnamed protein product [Protopolystoma xenopodis]|uniref:Uncharacterized protein n=1 Tax=Protopolystoma xenopodis TaxID=117903 RepID=A0A3S5C4S1_9PLAT|nr:unnamed protein product [Protopolystoma xenopodis]